MAAKPGESAVNPQILMSQLLFGKQLTYAEVEDLLQVKRGTLYGWVMKGVIPFVRLSGRVVRFRREEIETWIQSNNNRRHSK